MLNHRPFLNLLPLNVVELVFADTSKVNPQPIVEN